MVRSMYSGVSGMKAHQTRMDVIGNNISNVNTYGFKGSRATFRDVYYQSMRGAAKGTANKGGLNPTQIGYGAQVGSVDKLMTQSTMSMTGNPLDIGIAGEGFLQVQDPDGNIFYTKAGMLDIDPAGNLTDVNGNFVLGVSGTSLGQQPGSSKITFQIPPVPPTKPSAMKPINNVQYTVSFSNTTSEGNVSVNFGHSDTLAVGERVKVDLSDSSNIGITLNSTANFTNIADLNSAINAAITTANKGKPHPGGTLTVSSNSTTPFENLSGEQIATNSFGVDLGKVPVPDGAALAGTTSKLSDMFKFVTVGDGFTGTGVPTYTLRETTVPATLTKPDSVRTYEFTIGFAGPPAKTYTATPTSEDLKNPRDIMFKNGGSSADSITMKVESIDSLTTGLCTTANKPTNGDPSLVVPTIGTVAVFGTANGGGWVTADLATASTPSKNLGLAAQVFQLMEGTIGGPQTVNDLAGIKIGADGIITAVHPFHGNIEVGRIDLASFANQAGLEQTGNTYYAASANSGDPVLKAPGTAGTGALAQSSLEMSNVDLSQEFSDMITTQRGFQANSRLITVSDTMLEELINLKR